MIARRAGGARCARRARRRALGRRGWGDDPPALSSLVAFARTESDLRVAVDRYLLDKAAIERRYEVPYSPARHARLRDVLPGLAAAARRSSTSTA